MIFITDHLEKLPNPFVVKNENTGELLLKPPSYFYEKEEDEFKYKISFNKAKGTISIGFADARCTDENKFYYVWKNDKSISDDRLEYLIYKSQYKKWEKEVERILYQSPERITKIKFNKMLKKFLAGKSQTKDELLEHCESVYIFHMEGTDFYKIGYSNNIEKRLQTLQVSSPFNLSVIWQLKIWFPQEAERYLHQLFKEKKVKNEWFMLSQDDLDVIKNLDLISMQREQYKVI